MQPWQNIPRRDMPSSKSKTTVTSKSSIIRGNGWPFMERKKKPLWDKIRIIYREGHWKRRHLKEVAHMLGHVDLLSRPSMEMNTVWESVSEKPKSNCFFKNITLKISSITDVIGFYVLNSSHDTSRDASWIDRREKRHDLNNIFIFLERLIKSQT